MTAAELRFFRGYLREMAESFFMHEVVDSQLCEEYQCLARTPLGESCAADLFSRGVALLPKYNLRLRLKRLREMDGRPFPHIEVRFTARRRRRKVCFVGHRFIPGVARTLRWNLRQVLEQYNISLDWSGKDIRSVQIFDDIVQRIKKADFCIFDSRATAGRANVYIEVGVAYAVKTPFILFEYSRQRTVSIPSDLTHALAIRYGSYQRLFREFYFALPVFFKRNFGEGE